MDDAAKPPKGAARLEWVARTTGTVVAAVPILLGLDAWGEVSESEGGGVALALHAVMALPPILALAVAWFRPRWGIVAYLVLGAGYAGAVVLRAGLVGMFLFSAPFFILAGLFWWVGRSDHREVPVMS